MVAENEYEVRPALNVVIRRPGADVDCLGVSAYERPNDTITVRSLIPVSLIGRPMPGGNAKLASIASLKAALRSDCGGHVVGRVV